MGRIRRELIGAAHSRFKSAHRLCLPQTAPATGPIAHPTWPNQGVHVGPCVTLSPKTIENIAMVIDIDDREKLVCIVRQSEWFMRALRAVRSQGLPSWCIGAGAVRNLVWDYLHGHEVPSSLADVDVAYFDALADACQDAVLQTSLCRLEPTIPWEVTNQALVHTWFESYFGHGVQPLRSLHDAVATWPEYATSVGVTLDAQDHIDIIAPHGLEDLFSMVIRRNPTRVSVDTYRTRVQQKQYGRRWPRVQVVTE